jgi:hypothetical protein
MKVRKGGEKIGKEGEGWRKGRSDYLQEGTYMKL